MSNLFLQIAVRIIQQQERIIGPMAWEEASKVKGLLVDPALRTVDFNDLNHKSVIDNLIRQYMLLFGDASRLVCQTVVQDLVSRLPQHDRPNLLRF